MMLFVISIARVFEDLKRFEADRMASRIVNFVRISRHPERVTPPYIAYQSFKTQFVVLSLA